MKPGRFTVARCAFAALLIVVATPLASGHVLYGSIVGNVQDPTGSPVPGAAVTIRQTQTGATRSAASTESGALRGIQLHQHTALQQPGRQRE
jgi:hypothetical protein